MSSQTRIVILKMRNIIYTGIFIFLVLVLGVLLYLMFGRPSEDTGNSASPASSAVSNGTVLSEAGTPLYNPGCYSSILKLGNHSVNVSVTVSSDRIESIYLADVSEEITSAYPLLEPAMKDLNEKILATQSTEYLTYDEKMQYTQTALTDTINAALKKASASE
ncbi:MAG: hypothetical protein SOW08_07670 [Lachnospiraceae bacterium]|nr:hypothetical protein [Lachnospiraceae bacterium]